MIPVAGWDHGDGPGWWIVIFPLFWLVVIVGLVYLFRGRGRGGRWSSPGRETGIDVLERRFAEGELSLEQYRERRSVLEEER
ncbi:MAG: SHOCT domain-containing protein [Solirubrobacterales bacterium]|nr:SHOCT domain-containing protein [Solirubrobacterales bacterium]